MKAYKENLKKFRSLRKLPQTHKKVCDENKSKIIRRNKMTRVKFVVMEGEHL